MRHISHRACDNNAYPRKEVCLTEMMSEVRVSDMSHLETGEAGNRRSDAPMVVPMEMATAATAITVETAGATIFELMERYENRKWRSRMEAQATALAPSDWRSRMDRTVQQQAQEVMQLNRTFGHLTNVLEAQATPDQALWLGMMTWTPHREHTWDACLEDNKQWGAGTTLMIAKVMKGVAPGQAAREREKETRLQ